MITHTPSITNQQGYTSHVLNTPHQINTHTLFISTILQEIRGNNINDNKPYDIPCEFSCRSLHEIWESPHAQPPMSWRNEGELRGIILIFKLPSGLTTNINKNWIYERIYINPNPLIIPSNHSNWHNSTLIKLWGHSIVPKESLITSKETQDNSIARQFSLNPQGNFNARGGV